MIGSSIEVATIDLSPGPPKAPEILGESATLTREVQSPFLFETQIRSEPDAVIRWFRDGKLIEGQDRRILLIPSLKTDIPELIWHKFLIFKRSCIYNHHIVAIHYYLLYFYSKLFLIFSSQT